MDKVKGFSKTFSGIFKIFHSKVRLYYIFNAPRTNITQKQGRNKFCPINYSIDASSAILL